MLRLTLFVLGLAAAAVVLVAGFHPAQRPHVAAVPAPAAELTAIGDPNGACPAGEHGAVIGQWTRGPADLVERYGLVYSAPRGGTAIVVPVYGCTAAIP